MKILYGAGNINGSNLRLSHFLRHTHHNVRCGAFFKEHKYLNTIHWNLDALNTSSNRTAKEVQEITGIPFKVNPSTFYMMLDDISNWNPELVITDYEFITAYIAKILDIPMISCSPLHLIDGVQWKRGKKKLFTSEYSRLESFKHSVEKLIYSPFGLLENAPELNDGFEWITPYPIQEFLYPRETFNIKKTTELNDCSFNTGNSQNLYYDLMQGKKLCIADSQSNIEDRLNGIFVDSLGLGVSIGEGEKNHLYCMNKLQSLFNSNFEYNIVNEKEFLHERLSEL